MARKYSKDLPQGWWEEPDRFHIRGHRDWVQSKWDLDSPPVKFMQELLSDAMAQDIEWVYDIRPGGIRRELYSWDEKPNLPLSNFMGLSMLRRRVDVPDNADRVEETSGLNAMMSHAIAGQF